MAESIDDTGPLSCPSCERRYGLDERFCADCGMPLTYVGRPEGAAESEAHERARKVDPSYTEGELVRVAGARNQAEAEMIAGLLLEEGVPSVLRRTAGFDVPDFLAAGPRDVLVPEAGEEAARSVLHGVQGPPAPPGPPPGPFGRRAFRLAAAIVGGGLLAALIAWGIPKL
jgi:hypothetical protein